MQNQDPLKCPLHLVRTTFDALISEYALLQLYLAADAQIIHNKHFENGIVKLQRGDEKLLSKEEKKAISVFRLDATTVVDEHVSSGGFMDKVFAKQAKVQKHSNYRCVNHVSPTSNICERVFSRGKLIFTDQRGSMDPSTFEDILIMRYDDMWDMYLVQEIYDAETKKRQEQNAFTIPRREAEHEDDGEEEEEEINADEVSSAATDN